MNNGRTRIIARYLPQFHQIPENDVWWGKGFTEWTTVKDGKSLFPGHSQPKVPLNDNYYNLMDKHVMQWQADLAKKYGVDGFSFYHYWFKDGRRILEKPAENLLKWLDIDMPFCFTWANETWARTWSVLTEKNAWVTKEDSDMGTAGDGVLLRQSYGTEKEWLKHIHYLIPFFKDSRYIKYQGKPVFIIYRPQALHCWPDMRECWEQELHKQGLPGIFVIGESQEDYYNESPAIETRLWRFPDRVFNRMSPVLKNGVRTYDYDVYWQFLLREDWRCREEETGFYCIAPSFDSTPRHGYNGIVLEGTSPEKFKRYFQQLLQEVARKKDPFIFLNAWNEWGEGAYLEPDEADGFGFLQAVKYARETVNLSNGSYGEKKIFYNSIKTSDYIDLNRYRGNFYALNNWLMVKENGRTVAGWLIEQGINSVAIYGRGYMGVHLLKDLEKSSIEIKYFIEQTAGKQHPVYKVYGLEKDLPPVDAIIVTPTGRYDTIRRDIRKYVQYQTISLEYILAEML